MAGQLSLMDLLFRIPRNPASSPRCLPAPSLPSWLERTVVKNGLVEVYNVH